MSHLEFTQRQLSQRGFSSVMLRLAKIIVALAALPMAFHAHALEFSDIAQEGELRFLATHPDPKSYRYESRVKISEESLATGVVQLTTCHYDLDPIRKVVILFNPNRLQSIAIQSATLMGGVEVAGHRVTMSEVQRGASICIDLESKALDTLEDGSFRLQAGPLMRRYFDGYLPMQARLHFSWPQNLLSLKTTNPIPQPGVKLIQDTSEASMELVFAGRLTANIDLQRQQP